ncbi:hypothetical protein SAMN06265171_101764 [Chryseobacterium rhizoplanae]|uniref:Uncharacterized protein n=1 Tax=Chryseobacterium rhizoplanae TaxID=1609531 RepID=A0A521B7Y4_9FLAO|nr:hypothetical protein [Chryseobacterium rhizoplanae]SMO43193.1 hypothetical protein SAMN06265171_101764 [Chryseobacterium rhizoplanae]
MDQETTDYIINYFGNLMTKNEKLALKHQMSSFKSNENPQFRKIMIDKGWISSNPEITNLLENSYEVFKQNIVTRVMTETPEKVFFNNCPKCDKLARTPHAKQCRFCGYSWHHLIVAQFKLNDTIQITGRQFFLIGQIIEGEIREGQRIDLRILGLNKKIKIESIEFALKHQDEKVWEDISLGTNELTEQDKEYLKSIHPFKESLDIIIE